VYQTCCAWPKATYSSLRKKQTKSKALNSRLEKLKEITQSAEFKQKLAEDAARKKAETEERKRKRKEAMAEKQAAKESTILDGSPSGKKKTHALSSQERAIKYEDIKNRKKSPHPDIIV